LSIQEKRRREVVGVVEDNTNIIKKVKVWAMLKLLDLGWKL
jgi:hypothetical protein